MSEPENTTTMVPREGVVLPPKKGTRAYSPSANQFNNDKLPIWTYIEKAPNSGVIIEKQTKNNRIRYEITHLTTQHTAYNYMRATAKYRKKFINPVDGWLNHPYCKRAQYLDFLPGEPPLIVDPVTGEKTFNLWLPNYYASDIYEPNLLLPMQNHIVTILGRQIYVYLENWLAHMIQVPTRPTGKAIMLIGAQGGGKGVIGFHFTQLLSPNATEITELSDILGRFNKPIENSQLIYLDNTGPIPKYFTEKFKSYITQPKVTLRAMYRDPHEIRNCCNYLLSTNTRDNVMELELDNRRWVLLDINDFWASQRGTLEYKQHFDQLFKEAENYRVMCTWYNHLKYHVTLDALLLENIPETPALLRARRNFSISVAEWLLEFLRLGKLPRNLCSIQFEDDWPTETCWLSKEVLHRTYEIYFRQHEKKYVRLGERSPVTQTKFSQDLQFYNTLLEHSGRNLGAKKDVYDLDYHRYESEWCYPIPPLETFREMYAEATGKNYQALFGEQEQRSVATIVQNDYT